MTYPTQKQLEICAQEGWFDLSANINGYLWLQLRRVFKTWLWKNNLTSDHL